MVASSQLVFVMLAALSGPAEGAAQQTQPTFCGGELSPNDLPHYVEALRAELALNQSRIYDERLFAAQVTLIDQGVAHTIQRGYLERAKELPSPADWHAILALLEAGKLESVGWRGCILGAGKASFEADGNGNFGLRSFNIDQDWGGESF